MTAFVWLANARRMAGDGLKAGHIHNTGTATSIMPAQPATGLSPISGRSVTLSFGSNDAGPRILSHLGVVHLRIRLLPMPIRQ